MTALCLLNGFGQSGKGSLPFGKAGSLVPAAHALLRAPKPSITVHDDSTCPRPFANPNACAGGTRDGRMGKKPLRFQRGSVKRKSYKQLPSTALYVSIEGPRNGPTLCRVRSGLVKKIDIPREKPRQTSRAAVRSNRVSEDDLQASFWQVVTRRRRHDRAVDGHVVENRPLACARIALAV